VCWQSPSVAAAAEGKAIVAFVGGGTGKSAPLFVFGALGGPVSNLALQSLHVLHEPCWFAPALTFACKQSVVAVTAVLFVLGGFGAPVSNLSSQALQVVHEMY
jgi:hypothetical protein